MVLQKLNYDRGLLIQFVDTAHATPNGPRILLARAEAMRVVGDIVSAVRVTDEAWRISQARQMNLVMADALIMRGRLALNETTVVGSESLRLHTALDDADAAMRIARTASYLWAERSAAGLLSTIFLRLGAAERSKEYSELAAALVPIETADKLT